jgi:hypothetical protein
MNNKLNHAVKGSTLSNPETQVRNQAGIGAENEGGAKSDLRPLATETNSCSM